MSIFHGSKHLDNGLNTYLINDNAFKILRLLFTDVGTNISKATLYL